MSRMSVIIKPYNYCVCQSAFYVSELFYLLHKLDDVVSEQLRFLKGGEVAASRHEVIGVDVSVPNLRPGFGTVHQLVRERSQSGWDKYSRPKINRKKTFVRIYMN